MPGAFTQGEKEPGPPSTSARKPEDAWAHQRWNNERVSTLTPVLSSPGWELLETLQARQATHPISLTDLGGALRASGVEADLAAAVLTQLALRQAARKKFGPVAAHMVFTRDGLEQATRLVVAARHAQRFCDAGASRVADLGCGIGADALAIAGLGMDVLAVDVDPDAAQAAAANLRDFEGAQVHLGDVMDLDIAELAAEGVDAIFADPARRTGASRGSARIADPERWSPPLSAALRWAQTISAVGIKVAPGIAYDRIPPTWHAQWVSVEGNLVEASLWSPALAPEGPGRSCLLLDRAGAAHRLCSPDGEEANAPATLVEVAPLGAMIAEPDPAVIRSGMLGQLARRVGAGIVSESIAYLTGDDLPSSPFYDRFEVLADTNLRAKAISSQLRARGAGSCEIKKRGADIDPDALRKSLKLSGGGRHLTVIATRVGGRHRAIICKRLASHLSGISLPPRPLP